MSRLFMYSVMSLSPALGADAGVGVSVVAVGDGSEVGVAGVEVAGGVVAVGVDAAGCACATGRTVSVGAVAATGFVVSVGAAAATGVLVSVGLASAMDCAASVEVDDSSGSLPHADRTAAKSSRPAAKKMDSR